MLPCKVAIKGLCKEKKHLQHNIFDLFNWTFQLFQTDEVFIRNGHNQTQTQSDFIYHDRMTHCNWPEAKMRLKNTALFFATRVVALFCYPSLHEKVTFCHLLHGLTVESLQRYLEPFIPWISYLGGKKSISLFLDSEIVLI